MYAVSHTLLYANYSLFAPQVRSPACAVPSKVDSCGLHLPECFALVPGWVWPMGGTSRRWRREGVILFPPSHSGSEPSSSCVVLPWLNSKSVRVATASLMGSQHPLLVSFFCPHFFKEFLHDHSSFETISWVNSVSCGELRPIKGEKNGWSMKSAHPWRVSWNPPVSETKVSGEVKTWFQVS